jgi:peptidoglycan glycosyltransferase
MVARIPLFAAGRRAGVVSTIIFGSNPSGRPGAPQLWLGFDSIYFQPSELLKIILVAFLASYLAEQYPSLRAEGLVSGNRLLALSPRVAGPILLMWGLSVVILVWQRDLGTAILFFVVFLILLYTASSYTMILAGGAILIIIAGIIHTRDVVRLDDISNQLKPMDFQIVQSLQQLRRAAYSAERIRQSSPHIPVVQILCLLR